MHTSQERPGSVSVQLFVSFLFFFLHSVDASRCISCTARTRERIPRLGITTDSRRRHPETGVLLEEIRRAEHNANWLGRHDGEVLRAWEVRKPELEVLDHSSPGRHNSKQATETSGR